MFAVEVAGNPNTPPDVLARSAGAAGSRVRRAAAANSATPPDVLTGLAGDEAADVRVGVAGNAGTPAAVLAGLAGDTYVDVRKAVAANPGTPPAVLAGLLVGDTAGMVRFAAAANTNLDPERLAALTSRRTLFARRRDPYAREGAAANPNIDLYTLERFASAKDWRVRAAAAANRATPAATLAALVSDEHREVRAGVAGNVGTLPDRLAPLAGDEDGSVRAAAAANPNIGEDALAKLAGDRFYFVLAAVARNVNSFADVVGELAERGARSANEAVCWAAFGNPNLLDAALAGFLDDQHGGVRRWAQRGLAVRLAVPAHLRPPGTATLAQEWLALPDPGPDVDLQVSAVLAVADPGVRTGHTLAFGPGWEEALAAFRDRYGDSYDPPGCDAGRGVSARRRAPRGQAPPARWTL